MTEEEQRFWGLVEETDSGCWLRGGFLRNGYSSLSVAGRRVGAHVFSFRLHHGPVPEGLWVLHHCDVRNCIRPDHIYAGTAKDNAQDRERRGRSGKTGGAMTPRRDTCQRGHLMTDDNVYLRPDGKPGRSCLICKRAGAARSNARVSLRRAQARRG